MLRILLLIGTNCAVLLLATVTLNLLGVGHWLDAQGIGTGPLEAPRLLSASLRPR